MKKILRRIIEIDEDLCNGCGNCVTGCAEGALQIVGREAHPFDEEAVKKHLMKKEPETMPCGCPSVHIRIFDKPAACEAVNKPQYFGNVQEESALTHWPVQIKLIPAGAPFLKGADLLILADCTAVAFPALHRDLMKGKVVMMGCPKFDDVREYVQKFADIFKTAEIRSVTTVVMEVPCCSGMPVMVQKGMEAANKNIPMHEIVLSVRGKILKRQ